MQFLCLKESFLKPFCKENSFVCSKIKPKIKFSWNIKKDVWLYIYIVMDIFNSRIKNITNKKLKNKWNI